MKNDEDVYKQAIDEEIGERYVALREQSRYYDRLHFIELYPLNADAYYEGLKDWSKFREPKDTSHKEAEKDSGISFFLKVKAFFSKTSRAELDEKKSKAEDLQKEYSDSFSRQVEHDRKQFYKEQAQYNNAVELMKNKLKKHDSVEVVEFFKTVLQSDKFTLDMFDSHELYRNGLIMKEYNPETGELSYSYRIPDPEEICVIKGFYYDKESDSIISRELDKTVARNIRIKIARAILLRSAAMVYYSDVFENIKTIRITGYLTYFDAAFGTERDINVMSLEISKDTFNQIVLERVSLSELFERELKTKEAVGLYSKKPYELKGV